MIHAVVVAVECFCAGRYRSRDRSHCGSRDCACPPFNL
jgi:hypothetical protein